MFPHFWGEHTEEECIDKALTRVPNTLEGGREEVIIVLDTVTLQSNLDYPNLHYPKPRLSGYGDSTYIFT